MQRDSLVEVVAGHKAQIIQSVLAVIAVIIIEIVIVDGGVREGLLVLAVVVEVHQAGFGGTECVVGLEGDIAQGIAAVLLLEEIVEILAVELHLVSSVHLVGDVAFLRVAHKDLDLAVHIAAAGVIGSEVQRDGALTVAGDKAQAVEVVIPVTGAIIEPLVFQTAGGEGLLVFSIIIIIDGAPGGGEGVIGFKGDIFQGVIAVLLLKYLVEVPAVKVHRVIGVHLVGDNMGAAGAALHLNGQGAFGVFGAGVAGPEVQCDGAGLVTGHEGQVIQRVIAVVTVAVIKPFVFQAAAGEGFLVRTAVVIVDGAPGGGEGVARFKLHPAQGAGGEGVFVDVPEIAAVKGNLFARTDIIGKGVAGSDIVNRVICGVAGQGSAGHLGRALVALAVVDGGAAGVGGSPAHEGVSLAALGFRGRAGVGGRGALSDGLGAVCAGAVHEGDGNPVGHRHTAPLAHIADAVAVGIRVGGFCRGAAADGADLPVIAGIAGILAGAEGVAGLIEVLGAAGCHRAGVPVLGVVPRPVGGCLVVVGSREGHRLSILADGALLIPLARLEAGGILGGDDEPEVVGFIGALGLTARIGADMPVIGRVTGPVRGVVVLLIICQGGRDQAHHHDQCQQTC